MYIITVKLQESPESRAVRLCSRTNNHGFKSKGHCSEMECPNYINKCPKHSIPSTGERCSREKVTGQCPVGIGKCTDMTGEHHSYIDDKATSIEQAMENALVLGAHVTRIEELHPIR